MVSVLNLNLCDLFVEFVSMVFLPHLRNDNQKTTIGPWILAMKLHDPFYPSNSSVLDLDGSRGVNVNMWAITFAV